MKGKDRNDIFYCTGGYDQGPYLNIEKAKKKTWRKQVENAEKMKKFVGSVFFVIFWLDLGKFPYLEVYPGPLTQPLQ